MILPSLVFQTNYINFMKKNKTTKLHVHEI